MQDLDKDRLKKFSIFNCILISLTVFSLISTAVVEDITQRIIYFVICWVSILAIKYKSTKILIEKKENEKEVIQLIRTH
jgi:amino acid transporter